MDVKKIKISQDALYKFLLEHDVKISRLAELVGMTPPAAISCFRHIKNSHGNPRYFTVENIGKLNNALCMIAEELRNNIIMFGSEKLYTNKHGRTYDPGMIEPLNRLGRLVNITKMTGRILGWKKSKKNSIFCIPSSKNYGNISETDIMKINTEVMSVAGMLERMEVVPDERRAYERSKYSHLKTE